MAVIDVFVSTHEVEAEAKQTVVINTGGVEPDAVRYAEQNLTEEQKAQARENIGAVAQEDIKIDVVLYTNQSLSAEQKAQARQNIGAVAESDIESDVVLFTEQSLSQAQQAQARQNIGATADNLMIVTLDEDSGMASHNCYEVEDHINNGGTVRVEHNGRIYYPSFINAYNDDAVAFIGGSGDNNICPEMLLIGDDGSYGLQNFVLDWGLEERTMFVQVLNIRGELKSNIDAHRIYDHVRKGGTVYLLDTANEVTTLTHSSPNLAFFLATYDDQSVVRYCVTEEGSVEVYDGEFAI